MSISRLKTIMPVSALCALVLAMAPSDARATQKGCWLYADTNAKGKQLYMQAGQNIGTLAAHQFDNIASSVAASEGYRLEFFEDTDFTGKSANITGRHGNLTDRLTEKKKLIGKKPPSWNDRVSSVKCIDLSKPSTETKGCWLYADPYSKGKALFIAPGQSMARLADHNFEDITSSVRSTDGLRIEIYEDPNFGGKSMSVPSGRHNLNKVRLVKKTMFKKGKSWDDSASAVKCVKG